MAVAVGFSAYLQDLLDNVFGSICRGDRLSAVPGARLSPAASSTFRRC
jgi:hypothetical protein